jgi:predicted nicotinamide N-methyase
LSNLAGGGITRDLVFPLNLSRSENGEDPSYHERINTQADTHPSTAASEIVLKIYDAPLSDHTSVGVQTWGSAILLGRIYALDPWKYLMPSGLLSSPTPLEDVARDPRILELGAGTGVMSILIRRILDHIGMKGRGKVLATDYHPLVLENLSKCIRLNFHNEGEAREDADEHTKKGSKRRSRSRSILSAGSGSAEVQHKRGDVVDGTRVPGLETMLLDWSTFPGIVDEWSGSTQTTSTNPPADVPGDWTLPESISHTDSLLTDQMRDTLNSPWDLIIAADCVYDTRHAGMIRDVVKWCLRLPVLNERDEVVREGGVLVSYHI